jgi:hypothetical protein
MGKVAKLVMASILVVILCVVGGGSLLIYLRTVEHPCADYTYQDAVEFVERDLNRKALTDPSRPDNFLAEAKVCSTQSGNSSQQSADSMYNPFIVNICYGRTENVVAHAEIYSDCGLEWRRR